MLILFRNLTGRDKSNAIERLIKGSTPSQDFFFMITLSILTATFGLMIDEPAVVIGSMLIAPMLYPVLSLSLGITMADLNLVSRSFFTIVKSLLFAIVSSTIAALLFTGQFSELSEEILVRAEPSVVHVAIAIIAGFAGSFALVKPQLSETLPGIAISVALIPPLAVVGMGIARLDLVLASGAFLFFLVNAIGVIFASMITFSLMQFYTKRTKAEIEIKKEEKKLRKEAKRAEGGN